MVEKLRIYQQALELVTQIYKLAKVNNDLARDYSLNDQFKRAAVSVVANIAEGYLRTPKQFKSYLQIASGSANEVIALLQVIEQVYGIETESLQFSYRSLARQITAFSRKLIS